MVPIGASGDPARTVISITYPDGTSLSISNPKEVSIGSVEKTSSGFVIRDYKSAVSAGAVFATQAQTESNTEIMQAISSIFSIKNPQALRLLGLAVQAQTAACTPTTQESVPEEDAAPGTYRPATTPSQ